LRRALRGDFDQAALSDPVLGLVFGRLFALQQIAHELGLSTALGNSPIGKRALFLVLARLAHQGSRLSAVGWAQDRAVAQGLGLDPFHEDDLYAALEELGARQAKIEQALYRRYLRRRGQPPRLFLYPVTSTYLEGECNEWGAYGSNRDGKRGKLQIVLGLLTDAEGEPLAVRVFEANPADASTVSEQIRILQEEFQVTELVFVGDRGMVKSKGKQALTQARLHYISALTNPEIRRRLSQGLLQLSLFSEQVCEVEGEGVRYILRKNPQEAAREEYRMQDKLAKLEAKIAARNQQVEGHPRCQPAAGQRPLEAWIHQHKLAKLLSLKLEGNRLVLEPHPEAIAKALQLAGCYVVITDVAPPDLSAPEVHDSYRALQKIEQDFRTLKTGLLEVRPVYVRKKDRTRGHVFCCLLALKLSPEIERRLRAVFGTTDADPHALTLPDALASLSRRCLLEYKIDEKTPLTKPPLPNAHQQEILAALRVSLPKK
jgi:transposase